MVILLKLSICVKLLVMSTPSSLIMFFCLHKALYGLKQAPRAWYLHFNIFFSSLRSRSNKSDKSLFTFHRGKDIIYFLLYVDNIILIASSPALVSKVIKLLS